MNSAQTLDRVVGELSKRLSEDQANEFSRVTAEFFDEDDFLFISVFLQSTVTFAQLRAYSKMVRTVMSHSNPIAIEPQQWGAAVFIGGKICHIIHTRNSD